ncbi:MAG: PD-(D/E)XK nuclease family protein [Sedimentisphaerales bacterium]|nr:PD-(D/E)XK nuclease family protein [Sedimentisphaerales bacterium]
MKISVYAELPKVIESFKMLLKGTMDKPNMFIMPYDLNSEQDLNQFAKVVSCLKENFDIAVYELSPRACDLLNCNEFPNDFLFKCIVIDSSKIEGARDTIKESLWPIHSNNTDSRDLNYVLSLSENIEREFFTLSEYGAFIPYKTLKYDTIRTHTFSHKPFFYRYRVALDKIQRIPIKLSSYLQLLFTDCPNHLFKNIFRASSITSNCFSINNSIEHRKEHDLIHLAKKSKSFKEFSARHENLQKYFLLNDPCTIACEVPLWLEAYELNGYKAFFNTDNTLTGHIDLIRYEEDEKIGIWDYKPEAITETDALIQVSLYALMLSIRTGICIKKMICGYFDETDVFIVDPVLIIRHALIK